MGTPEKSNFSNSATFSMPKPIFYQEKLSTKRESNTGNVKRPPPGGLKVRPCTSNSKKSFKPQCLVSSKIRK